MDAIAEVHAFDPPKKSFSGWAQQGRIGSQRILLLKPATFMITSALSLDGVRVLDLSRVLAGPFCGMKAETQGATGVLRVPAGAEQLAAVLGPILDGLPQ